MNKIKHHKKRKQYTEKFKRAAIARMETETTQHISDKLKIPNSALYKWRRQLGLERVKHVSAKKKVRVHRLAHLTSLDAVVFLRKARKAMTEDLKAGKIEEFDRSHLLALHALDALSGGK